MAETQIACVHSWTRTGDNPEGDLGACRLCGKLWLPSPPRVKYILDVDDMNAIRNEGQIRLSIVENRGLGRGHGEIGRGGISKLRHHIAGAAGELVLCRHLNIDWLPEQWRSHFDEHGDVIYYDDENMRHDFEVRSSISRTSYLRIWKTDKNIHPAICVRVEEEGVCEILGWLYAGEVKNDARYRVTSRTPGMRAGTKPHWAVPWYKLRSIYTLLAPEKDFTLK